MSDLRSLSNYCSTEDSKLNFSSAVTLLNVVQIKQLEYEYKGQSLVDMSTTRVHRLYLRVQVLKLAYKPNFIITLSKSASKAARKKSIYSCIWTPELSPSFA